MDKHQIPPSQEILYRLPAVTQITGYGRSSIYKGMRDGSFPRPVQLSRQSVAWEKSKIDQWIAERPVADSKRIRVRRCSGDR